METERTLQVKSIWLNREAYGEFAGQLRGTISFVGKHAEEITVRVGPDKTGKILAIVANEIVTAAHEVAGMLLEDVYSQAAISNEAEQAQLRG